MDYVAGLGFLAGTFTSLAFVPQVIKVVKTKCTKGISALTYLIFILGLICWIIYSIILKSLPIFTANTLTLALAAPVLYLVIKNKIRS